MTRKTLDVTLNTAKVENPLVKVAVVDDIDNGVGSHSNRALNETSVSDVGNFCPLWLVIIKCI